MELLTGVVDRLNLNGILDSIRTHMISPDLLITLPPQVEELTLAQVRRLYLFRV